MADRTVAMQSGCMALGGVDQKNLQPIPFSLEPDKVTDGKLGHYCGGQSIGLCMKLYGMANVESLEQQMCRTCPD